MLVDTDSRGQAAHDIMGAPNFCRRVRSGLKDVGTDIVCGALQPEYFDGPGLDNLLHEACIGSRLSGCSSFVRQLGVVQGEWCGAPCVEGIIMENMAGGNLHDALQYAASQPCPMLCSAESNTQNSCALVAPENMAM